MMSWATILAEEIKKVETGGRIIVRSKTAKKLAERARVRMCPEKNIVFEVKKWNQ